MIRLLRTLAEAIAAIVGVGILLTGALIWRVSTQPISSNFMTPYIEKGIENIVPDSQVSVGDSLLVWDRAEKSISLRVTNIKVSDGAGRIIADIPSVQAAISLLGLVFGQIIPSDLLIEHPHILLTRDQDNMYFFGGMPMSSGGGQAPPTVDSVKAIMQNGFGILDRATLMHKLAINAAVLTVNDGATQKEWLIGVPEISIQRDHPTLTPAKTAALALQGHIAVDVTQKDGLATLNLAYSYDPVSRQHRFSTVFEGMTPAFLAGGHPETLGLGLASIVDLPITGKVDLFLAKDLSVDTIDAQIHGDAGHLVVAEIWNDPLAINNFELQTHYDRQAHILSVTDTHITTGDANLAITVMGKPSTIADQDMDLAMDISLDNLAMNRFDAVWPKNLLIHPRAWMTTHMHDGVFNHAQAHMNGHVNMDHIADLSLTDGGGQITASHGRVDYLDGMPSVTNVGAVATFDLNKMSVQITGGGLGAIRLQPFMMEITGLAGNDQDIHIPLRLTGPVPDILRLIDHPPLGYATALGIAPDDVQGKMDGVVDFRFPLLNDLRVKDVQLHAVATASAVATHKVIPQIAVDQGNLALTLDMKGFTVKGQVGLNKLPFDVKWQENFNPINSTPIRNISVMGVVRDNQWNNFGLSVFDGSHGPMNVALEIKKIDKTKTVFTGNIDFTPAATHMDWVGWQKPANSPALFHFTATSAQGNDTRIDSFDLRGDHLHVHGDATLSADMSQLLALTLDPFLWARNDAVIHVTHSDDKGGALRIEASGSALDISGLTNHQENEKDTGQDTGQDTGLSDHQLTTYRLNLNRLYTSANGEIDNVQGNASQDALGWRSINFHGLADGKVPLSVELTPWPDGHRTFIIQCDDFGKMMKGLGFTDTITGGHVNITGQSTAENPRRIDGHAGITDFTVEKLPALALLLNAASPFGLVGLLTDSTDFSRFEGDFLWQGDNLNFTRAHAVGSTLGINMDGKININSSQAHLQGTLVPFSVVNRVLNAIPLIGDLLTGGKDQGVLAVAYHIDGNLGNPAINVNPVSLLTPGFIRNLFFGDDNDNK